MEVEDNIPKNNLDNEQKENINPNNSNDKQDEKLKVDNSNIDSKKEENANIESSNKDLKKEENANNESSNKDLKKEENANNESSNVDVKQDVNMESTNTNIKQNENVNMETTNTNIKQDEKINLEKSDANTKKDENVNMEETTNTNIKQNEDVNMETSNTNIKQDENIDMENSNTDNKKDDNVNNGNSNTEKQDENNAHIENSNISVKQDENDQNMGNIIEKDKNENQDIKENKEPNLNDNESKNDIENKSQFLGKKREPENSVNNSNDIDKKQKIIIPKKKIIITLENNIYKFEVYEDIRIKDLKKMIYFASGTNKSQRIQLIHNNKEYNSHPNLKLSFYFPNLESITFEVLKKAESADNNLIENNDGVMSDLEKDIDEDSEKKNLCPLHYRKLSYYFCYDCNKPICFQCIVSGMHTRHKYRDERNQLKDSKNLIEKLFNDLTINLEAFDEKFITQFKDNIKIKVFPTLIQLIKKIQIKIIQIIEEFLKGEKGNIEKIKDILKNDNNKKLLMDEILTGGADILDLKNEDDKEKVNNSINDYKQFREQMKVIENIIEKIYTEIYTYLDNYLTKDIYEKTEEGIKNNDNIIQGKKDIFFNLISEVKKLPTILNSSKIVNRGSLQKIDKDKDLHLDNKNSKSKKIYEDEDHYKIIS